MRHRRDNIGNSSNFPSRVECGGAKRHCHFGIILHVLSYKKCCWVGNRLLHVSRSRVKCLHLLRRWESKLVRLREPRLQYHSTKETRHLSYRSLDKLEIEAKSKAGVEKYHSFLLALKIKLLSSAPSPSNTVSSHVIQRHTLHRTPVNTHNHHTYQDKPGKFAFLSKKIAKVRSSTYPV